MAKILFVDDELGQREAVGEILSTQGHEVTIAETYEKAMGLLEQQDFDLVITDYQLWNNTGLDIARWVHDNKQGTPIILRTGNDNIGSIVDKSNTREIFTQIISKCVNSLLLIRAVNNALGLKSGMAIRDRSGVGGVIGLG